MNRSRRAFTLVELMVVIGIIGILLSVLYKMIGGGAESAQNAKCLSNLKSLATACLNYKMNAGSYPLAGSVKLMGLSMDKNNSELEKNYNDANGWISWYSMGADGNSESGGEYLSCYEQDVHKREFCYTNGALWKYVSGNQSLYVCPLVLKGRKLSAAPAFSYAMNADFGWDYRRGKSAFINRPGISDLGMADRKLLFAEIPNENSAVAAEKGSEFGDESDCVIQYKGCQGCNSPEYIGFNHKSGKRYKFAHLVFADGHTEQLRTPYSSADETGKDQLIELTRLLCQGKSVKITDNGYEEMTDK